MYQLHGDGMNYTSRVEQTFAWALLIFLLVTVKESLGHNISEAGRPPSIVTGPPPHQLFNAARVVTLPCVATGTPPITYTWLQDGSVLELSAGDDATSTHLTQPYLSAQGSLLLPAPEAGRYQCKAHNHWGTTVSNVTSLQAIEFPSYYIASRTQPYNVSVGSVLTLPCYFGGTSVPPPDFHWATTPCRRGPGCNGEIPVKLDERVSIKDDGSLVFAYVLESDAQNGRIYKCSVHNPKKKKVPTATLR